MKKTITDIPNLTVHLGALWELPPDARVILLLGDRGCDHLREIARMAEFRGRAAFLIERVEELQPRWLVHAEAVGIILGSTALQPLLDPCWRACGSSPSFARRACWRESPARRGRRALVRRKNPGRTGSS